MVSKHGRWVARGSPDGLHGRVPLVLAEDPSLLDLQPALGRSELLYQRTFARRTRKHAVQESQSALSSQLNHALLEEGSFSVRGSWINDTFKPWLSIGSNNNPMAVPPGSAPETGAPKTLAPITGTSPRDLLGQTP